jgi:pyridoxal phosphate enzyme (YggS family)
MPPIFFDAETLRIRETIGTNLQRVRARIAAAAQRAGRSPDDVTLVAVTKQVDVREVQALLAWGQRDLGENRPQELWRKAEAIQGEVRWHLIGHLQRNKVRRTLPLVSMIHSVDSLRLLHALEQEAAQHDARPRVLLEVNASGEQAKHGFLPDELLQCQPELRALERVRVEGLMTMAALVADPERARPAFQMLRALCDRLRSTGMQLTHLSMGMTNDFEVAVEEGATMVRVGRALFEGVPPTPPSDTEGAAR